jgi:hypothetical protein
MINKIIDGICEKLNESFGDGYEIYTELKNQGLKEPCFSVMCVNPINNQVIGNRYFRNNLFSILYFPASKEPKAECNTVLEKLYLALETIKIKETLPDESIKESLVRGTNMRGELVDGVLNFLVNFNLFVYKVEDADLMEEVIQKSDLR